MSRSLASKSAMCRSSSPGVRANAPPRAQVCEVTFRARPRTRSAAVSPRDRPAREFVTARNFSIGFPARPEKLVSPMPEWRSFGFPAFSVPRPSRATMNEPPAVRAPSRALASCRGALPSCRRGGLIADGAQRTPRSGRGGDRPGGGSEQPVVRAIRADGRLQEQMRVFDCADSGFGEIDVVGGPVARAVQIGALAARELDSGLLHGDGLVVEEALPQELPVQ